MTLNMNSNDEERSTVTVDNDRIIGGCRAQGNNVASVVNSNRSTIKIDSLSIKLGIVKEKSGAEKCRHFSIRGYVAGMRERGGNNFLPFTELPPMDIPNFRYWLCQRCLQKDGTASSSHETPVVSVCDQCLVRPCVRSCPPQDYAGVAVLPFGEDTLGIKPDDSRNNDQSLHAALGAEKSRSSQEIPAKAGLSQQIPAKVNGSLEISSKVKVSHEIPPKGKISQETPKYCSTDTNVAAPGKKDSNDLKAQEEPQKKSSLKETITNHVSQPMESGQQNDYPNGHPRRKAQKVRLLKELLCGNTEIQQQKKENCSTLANSFQIKKKNQHDRDLTHDHAQRTADVKKSKCFKGNAVTKRIVVEHLRDPVAHEGGETTNKFQWNKLGTPRNSVQGKVGSDAMTAWRSVFNDKKRADNQVTLTPTFSVSKGSGTEPYSNFMAPPKPNKKFNASSKKISSNPIRSKFRGDDSRRMKDPQSDTDLGLGLSLIYDPEAHARSLPPLQNQILSQDQSRKAGFLLRESSNFEKKTPSDSNSKKEWGHDASNGHTPRIAVLQEQRPYTQPPYAGCSGIQKLDFSDPHKTNTGVRGYADVTRPHNHQRQENMFSIGRSDEREIIELMAKNQYERSLCEARSHFSPSGSNNNGIVPNAAGFGKVNLNEGMPSAHHEYLSMIRPTSENLGPTTMRSSDFTIFDGLTQNQKQPMSGIWIPNPDPRSHFDSHFHYVPKGYSKISHTQLYDPNNMITMEASYKYSNGSYLNEAASMPYGQAYGKYSKKDKGKNMMDLDLNVVAPNVIEDYNNLESLDNSKRMSSLDSSYSNEVIPAMQLLSLMDAGKSSQPFNTNGQKLIAKPLSPLALYSQCGPSVIGKKNQMVTSHFPYSGLRPCVQYSNGSLFSSMVQTGQNGKLTSSHGQRVYYKQEDKSRGCRQDDSYVFPLPWHAIEDRNKVVNGVSGPGFGPSGTEICTINRNPSDFSTPGPENIYMVNAEDLMFNGECSLKIKSASGNVNGPKRQKVNKVY